MEKRLFLLDAYALIFRAYYALIRVPRFTKDGFNTSAIFGFVNTLEEVLRKERPSHIAVCFDPAGKTFRSEAYAEYKGERASTPEDIKLSVPIIKEILKAYNIPVIECEGFEADDVIGTLARKGEEAGFTVYMMTPDKDFGQLVSPNVLQYKPAYRGQDFELRGEEEVKARYGLQNTKQVIDLLALMGDKIDNIPGCPGVGEKTAVKLIGDFGSVENLIANTDKLKGALRKKVEENSEQIVFSKYLATIRTDVPVEFNPEALRTEQPDTEKLFAIFSSLEFRTLIDRVKKRLVPDAEKPKAFPTSLFDDFADEAAEAADEPDPAETRSFAGMNYDFKIVDNEATLSGFSRRSAETTRCGIAIVAQGENDVTLKWSGTAVAFSESEAYFIPMDNAEAAGTLLDLLARPDLEKVAFDTKPLWVSAYLARVARDGADRAPLNPLYNYFDVELAHYLLHPDLRHTPQIIASAYLNYEVMPAAPAPKKGAAPEPAEAIRNRALEEACVALSLRDVMEKEVKKVEEWDLLTLTELPLVKVLAKMEIAGVRIDMVALNEAAREMSERIGVLESEIHDMAGEEFNVGSPSKVGEILFDKLGLDPKAKKTKTGQYSTSEDILEKIAHKNAIVGKILDYRKLRKLLSTYLTALPTNVNAATGRIHTTYNQSVTATGRISSSNPNLQNIPVREEMGREIRRAFIPSEGNVFLSADYSQIELRLVADFAEDETMIHAFAADADIHAITAAKIYHKTPEEVTADERRHAKTANFGILYGITAFGLASRLGIPRGEAKDLIDNYFTTFPTIRRYMTDSIESAREKGYAITRYGRRRYLPDILSKNPTVRGFAERNAVNAPVQGSAADIMKRAMVAIDAEMERRGMKSKMIMQVHDELNFDTVPEEAADLQTLVTTEMEKAYTGRVALTASSGIADNWLDAH